MVKKRDTMPGTKEYKSYNSMRLSSNYWPTPQLSNLNGEDEDRNMLIIISSGRTPRTLEKETLTCETSRPVAKMLEQARLMVQITM